MRKLSLTLLALLAVAPLRAQTIPTPEQHFGFALGADKKLADWSQLTSWYQLLATRSPRIAASRATAAPLIPPPITKTSNVSVRRRSMFRWRSCAERGVCDCL